MGKPRRARWAVPLLTPSSRQTFAQDAPERLRAAILKASTTTLGRPRRLPLARAFRSPRSVLPLVEEMLRPFNNGHYAPESTMTLERFVETIYLPYVAEQKRPSTFRGYRDIWEYHLKARCGIVRDRKCVV